MKARFFYYLTVAVCLNQCAALGRGGEVLQKNCMLLSNGILFSEDRRDK